MITQCFQLHDSTMEQNQPYGDVFKETLYTTNQTAYFGNKLNWNRSHVWKLVEYLGPERVVEHICFIDQKENMVLPLLSKYIFASTPYAYCQTYTQSIGALLDKYAVDSVMCTDGINNCVYDQVMESLKTNTPFMTDYMKEWKKSNLDVGYISPLKTCLQNTDDEETQLIKQYGDFDNASEFLEKAELATFNKFYMPTTNVEYIRRNVDEISGNLENAFIDVKCGQAEPTLLDQTLIANFAPWKQISFPEGTLRYPNLGTSGTFVSGELSYDKLLNMMHTSTSANGWIPKVSDIRGIGSYMKRNSFYIPEYDKEFISLLEYIQSLGLTDFCYKFKINDLSLGIRNPEVIESQCRYFNCLSPSRENLDVLPFLNSVYYNSDFLVELSALLENWLCISQPMMQDEFDTVKVMRTFNEELIFHFENSVYGNEEVMYYDIIGGSICGRNMCNLGWLRDKNIHYLPTAI